MGEVILKTNDLTVDFKLKRNLFGKPDRVAYTSCRCEGKDYDEHYRFSYGYSNGLNVVAEAGWLNAAIPFMAHWRVYFEHGMLIYDENGENAADGHRLRRCAFGDHQ